MNDKGIISPRPYARLITMIGDQLIRNEKIALIELIKNSYDADATWVQIRFNGFEKKDGNLTASKDSSIEIEDDGIGMTFEIIKDVWLNPASPYKYFKKRQGDNITAKGRIMQGEKGIGRYAAFKLGDTVEIFSRSIQGTSKEIYLKSDLSIYDDELTKRKTSPSEKKPIFIDEIEYDYEINTEPKRIKSNAISFKGSTIERADYGTLITISNLKGTWSEDKIDDILRDCLKMMSPFNDADFVFDISINGRSKPSKETERLDALLEMAQLKMDGTMSSKGDCTYSLNDREAVEMPFEDIAQDKNVRSHFFTKNGELIRPPHCGPFKFTFYVFDLDRRTTLESPLDELDRELIKSNRIYLYRDGIRVYPYGDPSDDWLELDILRGTHKAGDYLSNDQITGYIAISSTENPDLRDKTNREGLMDIGNAYKDLKVLVLSILGFLNKEFKKVKINKALQSQEHRKQRGHLRNELRIEKTFATLLDYIGKSKDVKADNLVRKLIKDYTKENDFFKHRIEIVEDLAAVGMTVEAASHDLMIMMSRANDNLNGLMQMTENDKFDYKKLRSALVKLQEQHNFLHDQLSGIQPLFRSAKRGVKSFNISTIITTVSRYYSVPMEKSKIVLSTQEIGGPLKVRCSEAILLQVFINLFDNAVYWLATAKRKDKKIDILIDSDKAEVIFSDNGPGVNPDDISYIFEPFFSTKGIQGRGLGLYIAQQLLERSNYDISYITDKERMRLSGANFAISFGKEEQKD